MSSIIIRIAFVTLISTPLLTLPAFAADGSSPSGYRMGTSRAHDNCCRSPDYYCRKQYPLDPCPSRGCYADCYARKPFPAEPCVSGCGTANDYIRKCFPRSPWQCATPSLPRGI